MKLTLVLASLLYVSAFTSTAAFCQTTEVAETVKADKWHSAFNLSYMASFYRQELDFIPSHLDIAGTSIEASIETLKAETDKLIVSAQNLRKLIDTNAPDSEFQEELKNLEVVHAKTKRAYTILAEQLYNLNQIDLGDGILNGYAYTDTYTKQLQAYRQ